MGLAASTEYQRCRALTRLSLFITPMCILEAEEDHLRAYLNRPQGTDSRASETSHVRKFYAWAEDRGHVDRDPARRLRRPKTRRTLPRPMSEADLYMALAMAPDRIRPWLLLAAWAGLRCHDMHALRADDLWWHLDPPLVVVRNGKGGRDGAVPMSPWLTMQLRECDLPKSGWLFPRRDGQAGPVSASLISGLTNRYLHSIGITATIHQARHWFGTEVYRASGRDLRLTQELLRHESPRSTAIYTFVDPRDGALAVAALPVPG